jgi:hydrogenase nickel incorporation protein HypA/HybF
VHEYSVVESLLDRVRESARGYHVRRVRRLRLRLGALSGVDAGLLRTAYDLCAPGTFCDGAELQIEAVAPRWRCSSCGQDSQPVERLICAACGGGVTLLEGDEIVLEKVDLEVEDV